MMDDFRLSHDQCRALINHALADYPAEACGLIGGKMNIAHLVLPVPNAAEKPQTQYQMAIPDLLKALKQIDAAGLDLIGIYHSHPKSDPSPSPTDIRAAQQHYPNIAHLIISLNQSTPRLKAWQIQPGQVTALEVLVGDAARARIGQNHLSSAQHIAILLATLLSVVLMISISLVLLPPAPIITPAAR